MADTEQGSEGRASFGTTIVQHLGGALLVIGVVAGAFWAIGSMDDDTDPAPVVADAPEAPEPSDEAPDPDGSEDDPAEEREEPEEVEGEDIEAPPTDADESNGGGADEPDADETDGSDEADDAPEDEPADDGSEDDGADDGSADTDAADDGAAPEPAAPAIDPTTVTVQVLDGYQEDGGSAAGAVADELQSAGYDIIARNPALRYDQTVVLFNAGSEDAARQLAASIGAAEVREQPGNLSTAVDLHVVVGADRG